MPSTRRLQSSLTHQLDVRQSQCATVGDRPFTTADARLWNSLPTDIVACDTLSQFRRELKNIFSCTFLLFLFFIFCFCTFFVYLVYDFRNTYTYV